MLVVFGHDRWQEYHWYGLVMLWGPSDVLALYDGYLGGIYGFCSSDAVCGNWKVPDLVLLNGLF